MTQQHEHQPDESNIVPLRPEAQPNPGVIDAEIVSEEPRPTFNTRRLPVPHISEETRQRMADTAVELRRASAPYVVTGTKGALRHTLYVPAGAAVVAKRIRDSRGTSRYERLLRVAEAQQDWDRLGEWEEREARARQQRHDRHMDWLKAPAHLAKAVAVSAAAGIGLLLALGVVLAVADGDAGMVLEPIGAAIDTIRWLWWFGAAYGALLLTGGLGLGVLYLWDQGRKHSAWEPRWARPVQRSGEGEPVTPHRVIAALSDLGLSTLRKKLSELGEESAQLLGPVTIAGCGVEVDVTLPTGVTTEEIKAKRRKLAENLDRHEHELFITTAPAARTVRLWVADPGALDEPIEPSPLVLNDETTANVYSGQAPWGQNLRGDAVALNLWQKHLLITGLSNMGKTAALRSLVLWAAFDPSVELRIADLKGIGDWRMFRGIATTLIEGPTDEHVIEATHMLEAGVREMERRMQAFDADKYPDGVPPNLEGFHPVYLIVDEAQVAFMCPAAGEGDEEFHDPRPFGGSKNTSRYFMAARKIHNQGRAVNVVLWQGTQDPTDQNLPKLVREGAHIRASLNVGTPSQARMALGDNAVDQGAAPHELKQEHKGTVVVTGAGVPCQQGQIAETVRTHFVSGTEAVEVADRIKALRGERATVAEIEHEQRDLLADVAEVLGGEDKVKATDVAARLRKLARGYPPYADMGGEDLRDRLAHFGVKVTKVGVLMVYAERVHAALAQRQGGNP
ncbi:cell division protein FtsK [Saccharomonospora piscinae]|uniref:Cell division protein FtsK n=1 Tax=Saccharomonospora piscinae TaxID=687388 RepID=A0A1V9A4G2_SACPI|nr:FtsK/SpoIIIE domain-containing protein [Saccharomonospora piscinae]OQO91963.1 cell division protein FtsK [Saccharomonospora piscinae]